MYSLAGSVGSAIDDIECGTPGLKRCGILP